MTKLAELTSQFDRQRFLSLNEEISFDEYLEKCWERPKTVRSAYQRIYDMIMCAGTSSYKRYRKSYTCYHFFDDTEVPVFSLDDTKDQFVKFIRGAAGGFGSEKRLLLLHGPVGSAKSTLCRLLKRGLERFSRTDDGAWYTFKWVNLPEELFVKEHDISPMNDEPLKLLTPDIALPFLQDLNKRLVETVEDTRLHYDLKLVGSLNPRCKFYLDELLRLHDGDLNKVLSEHVRVIRRVHSEADRTGIGTFAPKDEKNQDSTELNGDIAWDKISKYGSDSDPRAFNFDGEFCVGSRGVVEWIEVLKLQKEFLYDLLSATQEQCIKPKKFPQIGIDTVLIGHTNNPEYKKLQEDIYMEAFRDRTVKVDVPYLLEISQEKKIYDHDYGEEKVQQHIAPHTLEMAALWGVITRLKECEACDDPIKLAKLYDGQALPGWTEDRVREIKETRVDEGMGVGISARYIQDALSCCLSDHHTYINPFMLINELERRLRHSSVFAADKDLLKHLLDCIDSVKKELDEILKNEVKNALISDEKAVVRLCTNYIDNLMAYIEGSKVTNEFTGREEEPNEALMRSIEEKIRIPDTGAHDFRVMIQGYIGKCHHLKEEFTWKSNDDLKRALEAKLYEDTKDHIKLSALNVKGASTVDPDLQEKIDVIKKRMIEKFGYIEESATDVLNYVGSIFARGELAKEE